MADYIVNPDRMFNKNVDFLKKIFIIICPDKKGFFKEAAGSATKRESNIDNFSFWTIKDNA